MAQNARVRPQPGHGRPVMLLKEHMGMAGSVSGLKMALIASTLNAPSEVQKLTNFKTFQIMRNYITHWRGSFKFTANCGAGFQPALPVQAGSPHHKKKNA